VLVSHRLAAAALLLLLPTPTLAEDPAPTREPIHVVPTRDRDLATLMDVVQADAGPGFEVFPLLGDDPRITPSTERPFQERLGRLQGRLDSRLAELATTAARKTGEPLDALVAAEDAVEVAASALDAARDREREALFDRRLQCGVERDEPDACAVCDQLEEQVEYSRSLWLKAKEKWKAADDRLWAAEDGWTEHCVGLALDGQGCDELAGAVEEQIFQDATKVSERARQLVEERIDATDALNVATRHMWGMRDALVGAGEPLTDEELVDPETWGAFVAGRVDVALATCDAALEARTEAGRGVALMAERYATADQLHRARWEVFRQDLESQSRRSKDPDLDLITETRAVAAELLLDYGFVQLGGLAHGSGAEEATHSDRIASRDLQRPWIALASAAALEGDVSTVREAVAQLRALTPPGVASSEDLPEAVRALALGVAPVQVAHLHLRPAPSQEWEVLVDGRRESRDTLAVAPGQHHVAWRHRGVSGQWRSSVWEVEARGEVTAVYDSRDTASCLQAEASLLELGRLLAGSDAPMSRWLQACLDDELGGGGGEEDARVPWAHLATVTEQAEVLHVCVPLGEEDTPVWEPDESGRCDHQGGLAATPGKGERWGGLAAGFVAHRFEARSHFGFRVGVDFVLARPALIDLRLGTRHTLVWGSLKYRGNDGVVSSAVLVNQVVFSVRFHWRILDWGPHVGAGLLGPATAFGYEVGGELGVRPRPWIRFSATLAAAGFVFADGGLPPDVLACFGGGVEF
jgi:hypothetical protein